MQEETTGVAKASLDRMGNPFVPRSSADAGRRSSETGAPPTSAGRSSPGRPASILVARPDEVAALWTRAHPRRRRLIVVLPVIAAALVVAWLAGPSGPEPAAPAAIGSLTPGDADTRRRLVMGQVELDRLRQDTARERSALDGLRRDVAQARLQLDQLRREGAARSGAGPWPERLMAREPALDIAPRIVVRPHIGTAATLPPKVLIHHSRSRPAALARARALAAALADRGFEITAIRPVEADIAHTAVRYFSAREAAVAADVDRLIGRIDPEARRQDDGLPQDFSHVRPGPQPGTVEVWLGS